MDSPVFALHNTGQVLTLVDDEETQTVEEAIAYFAEEGVEAHAPGSSGLFVSVDGLRESVLSKY